MHIKDNMKTRQTGAFRSLLPFYWLALFFLLRAGNAAAVTNSPPAVLDAATVARMLGYSEHDVEALCTGEIIFHGLEETSKKEIAVTGAMLLEGNASALYGHLQKGTVFRIDPTTLSRGSLPDRPVTAEAFSGLKLPPEEIEQMKTVEPGTTFNFSSQEIKDIRAAAAGGAPAVKTAFFRVLADRVNAYRRGGIHAIAPYDRGKGKSTSPAEQLVSATEALTTLKKLEPKIYQAFLDYPKQPAPGLTSKISWSVHDIQDRPTVVLSHWMTARKADSAILLVRQFYVEQSYNAQQIVAAILPVRKGALVFYVNRTASDQVDRLGSATVHKVARVLVEREVKKFFETIRDAWDKSQKK